MAYILRLLNPPRSPSFPHAFSGGSTRLTTGETGTGPPIRTLGGDGLGSGIPSPSPKFSKERTKDAKWSNAAANFEIRISNFGFVLLPLPLCASHSDKNVVNLVFSVVKSIRNSHHEAHEGFGKDFTPSVKMTIPGFSGLREFSPIKTL